MAAKEANSIGNTSANANSNPPTAATAANPRLAATTGGAIGPVSSSNNLRNSERSSERSQPLKVRLLRVGLLFFAHLFKGFFGALGLGGGKQQVASPTLAGKTAADKKGVKEQREGKTVSPPVPTKEDKNRSNNKARGGGG